MFDTLTVLAYLITHESQYSGRLHLRVLFSEKQAPVSCVQHVASPQLRWRGVPPEADSLAVIIKDNQPEEKTGKPNYYWVAYNLPTGEKGLPFGISDEMNPNDQIITYHSPWACNNPMPSVQIELYALDKRFGANKKMTGAMLEKKIQGHILAKTVVQG